MSDSERETGGAMGARGTVERSKEVRLWLEATAERADNSRGPQTAGRAEPSQKVPKPDGLAALSLSGGGIRSATFSLGIIQALAKSNRDALAKIDILSTVSGGGYIGCFLRSLFVPQEARGIAPDPVLMDDSRQVPLDPKAVNEQRKFARAALESGVDVKEFKWERPDGTVEVRRNPLWWLREHSRYLAPNGPTDYGYAVAYLTRNWVAMLYIFLIAALALSGVLILAEAAVAQFFPSWLRWTWVEWGNSAARALPCGGGCAPPVKRIVPVSPIVVFLAIPVLFSAALSVAYWLTERMSSNEPDLKRQTRNLRRIVYATLGAAVVLAVALLVIWWSQPQPVSPTGLPLPWVSTPFRVAVLAGIFVTLLAAAVAMARAARLDDRGPLLTAELRRGLTGALGKSNFWFLVVAGMAAVDALGAGMDHWFRFTQGHRFGAAWAALLPIFAFLLKKLPDWVKGGSGKGGFAGLIVRFAAPAALLAGVLLYGVVAVAANAVVHHMAWQGQAWTTEPRWIQLSFFAAVVIVLAILSGTASGFINLSSLHALYASRLTRAYLGASNMNRLVAAADPARGSSIKDNDAADYIQPNIYCRADLPAPIHIINATINETIDPQSQIVARDRKGDIISLEPSGVRIGSGRVGWEKLGDPDCAEHISLGQWCAISGAAASSGMGRLTNLGFALALTFANVRLGYWWWSPGVSPPDRPETPRAKRMSRLFGTFIYLLNEMTARYSRGYVRKYLTDGGHFEDTGAYRLIEHKVPLILLSDNGADPQYRFADLENLVRLVRLDFGLDLDVLGGGELKAFLDELGASDRSIFIDGAAAGDWRDQFSGGNPGPFVIVLRGYFEDGPFHILWIKPRVIAEMPADLMGYSAANPAFPQQTTGDQFFDEAQWESYRKLGELCTQRLLSACPQLFA